jgi:hypothetical protein
MPFNVGDVVSNCGTEYVVAEVNSWGEYYVCRKSDGESMSGYHEESIFTLVTPAVPPTPVLTGMTQFFKDHKEKTNVTA